MNRLATRSRVNRTSAHRGLDAIVIGSGIGGPTFASNYGEAPQVVCARARTAL